MEGVCEGRWSMVKWDVYCHPLGETTILRDLCVTITTSTNTEHGMLEGLGTIYGTLIS